MKHKLISAFLSFVVLSSSCSSCSDDSDDNKGGDSPSASGLELVGDATTFTLDAEGASQDVILKLPSLTASVTASPSADWLTANKGLAPASGQQKWVVTATKNETGAERSATVDFLASGYDTPVTVTFVQPRLVPVDEMMPSDAKTLVSKIYAGINIGNTLEVPNSDDEKGETGWGNPRVNADYIAGLKALGFNAVRIPCAMHSHQTNADTHTISSKWLDRIKEVVGYCVDNDMYVVLNSHWDTGWLEDNIFEPSRKKAILDEQTAIWTQVANALNKFDEHLLFAGCNEPGMNETTSGGHSWEKEVDAAERLIAYEQAFIDAVRATGGNNAKRCLVFQGLGTDIGNTASFMKTFPSDPANPDGRLIAEVHFYEPYPWALMENDASWGKVFFYWGKDNHKDGSAHNPTWGEESHVESQMAKMKSTFVDAGIPVIIGEYSTRIQTRSTDDEEFDAELHKKSRAYYNEFVTKTAKNNGCATFYWETGGEIDRNTGKAKNQYAIDGIMAGAEQGKYPF